MREKIGVLLGAAACAAVFVSGAYLAAVTLVPAAAAEPGSQVCPPGDSGKIDTPGAGSSLTITAPAGFLIYGYCVKAGSANQGLGPEFVSVDPPQKSVTISHSSGKGISHYSALYVEESEEEPPPTTTEEEEPPPTTTGEEPPCDDDQPPPAPGDPCDPGPDPAPEPKPDKPKKEGGASSNRPDFCPELAGRQSVGCPELPFTGASWWEKPEVRGGAALALALMLLGGGVALRQRA